MQASKRSIMVLVNSPFADIQRFADTQDSCFEAWKRSHMGYYALLCGRFAESQESRFQALKRSNMGSAVQEVGRSANIHKFFSSYKAFRYGQCRNAIWSIC